MELVQPSLLGRSTPRPNCACIETLKRIFVREQFGNLPGDSSKNCEVTANIAEVNFMGSPLKKAKSRKRTFAEVISTILHSF